MKNLLVIGGGAEASVSIEVAKRRGDLRVFVADGNAGCDAWQHGTRSPRVADGFVEASTYDPDAILSALDAAQLCDYFDGVIALVADVPLTVATVAEALDLPGLPPRVAALGADKATQEGILLARGIRVAAGSTVGAAAAPLGSLFHIAQSFGERVAWVVVKPVDSRGARGVTRHYLSTFDKPTAAIAFETAAKYSATQRVLVEPWLDGPQLSTETVLLGNGVTRTYVLDRNYRRLAEFAPYVVEDGAEGPSALAPYVLDDVCRYAERAAVALVGPDARCTVKGDLVLTPDGPAVVEMALRLSGGYMSSVLIPEMTGVDLVGVAVALALGESVDAEDIVPTRNAGVAIRYEIPPGCTCHPERGRHRFGFGSTRRIAVESAIVEVARLLWTTDES